MYLKLGDWSSDIVLDYMETDSQKLRFQWDIENQNNNAYRVVSAHTSNLEWYGYVYTYRMLEARAYITNTAAPANSWMFDFDQIEPNVFIIHNWQTDGLLDVSKCRYGNTGNVIDCGYQGKVMMQANIGAYIHSATARWRLVAVP